MPSMQVTSERALQSGQQLIERYGSWSAVLAAGQRRADGVVILPPAPPAQQQGPDRDGRRRP